MKPGFTTKQSTIHLCLILGWLPGLAIAVAGYFGVVAPLLEKALLAESYGIARQVDENLMARSIFLNMATDKLKMESLQEPAVLDELLQRIRSRFPDFISLEVIDNEGTIVSMVGELSLSQEGLPMRANTSELAGSSVNGYRYVWAFRDDPAGDSYYLTRERTDPGGQKWFSRARFARGPIQAAVDNPLGADSLRVRLAPIEASRAARAPESIAQGKQRDEKASPTITDYRWGVPAGAAARLATPGWEVTVETGSKEAILWYGALLLAGVWLMHVLIAIRVGRSARNVIRHESLSRAVEVSPILSHLALHREFKAPVSDVHPPSVPRRRDLSTDQPRPGGFHPIWPGPFLEERDTGVPLDRVSEEDASVEGRGRDASHLPEFLEVEWSETSDADKPRNRNIGEDEHRFPPASPFLHR